MTNDIRSYKYSCRKCPIRQRCIDAKGFGPGLKTAIARRFEGRTDTFETWDMLQQDCLLVRQEQQDAADRLYHESALMRRLRAAREEAAARKKGDVPAARDPFLSSATPQTQPIATDQAHAVPGGPTPVQQGVPCGLSVVASQRLVRIPDDGEIVLGRFEHGFSNPPDVDLAFEDGEIPSVSRRHALITGREGEHWIEDMGSSNGTYVNGHLAGLGQSVALGVNDRILLGRCRLTYSPLAGWIVEPDPRVPHTTQVVVTHSGLTIELSAKREIIVGRPDPTLGFEPDVDLSVAGDISMYISRRHVKIVSRAGFHFVEELGSAAGSRLNGKTLRVGESPVMLQHGDQLWLGGCVLAYEWKLT
jgi:pSer/pThr/pTyr-binding forkhead associated (FHA) protein